VQQNRRTDQILLDLLGEVRIAPPLMQSTLLDVAGNAALGVSTFLTDARLPHTFDAGQTTLSFAGDNRMRPRAPGEASKDS